MKAAAKVIASAQEGRPPDSSGVGNAGMEERESAHVHPRTIIRLLTHVAVRRPAFLCNSVFLSVAGYTLRETAS